jgi:hypothetical protein
MTPQMQHEHMMQQWYFEQMMLNEMMSSRRAPRHNAGQGHPGPSESQAGTNPQQAGANRAQRGAIKSESAINRRQSNQEDARRNKQGSAASKHRELGKNLPSQKSRPRKETPNHRLPLAADQPTISLLRTVHMRLSGADHDYQGHRVKALGHVAAAIRHLHPSSSLNTNYAPGLGNLPQARSDEILREAMRQLGNAETSLGTGTESAAHHRGARASVAEAIHELHKALEVR